jgi:hypothetical protein
MSETLKRLFTGTLVDPLTTKNELVVVPSIPSLVDLTALTQNAHDEVERALQTAVEKGMEAGKALREIKHSLPFGLFEDFIAAHFTFTMGTAQKYMRFAKQEAKLRQLIEQKRSAGLHLGMREALKFLNKLTAEDKPKPIKRRPEA